MKPRKSLTASAVGLAAFLAFPTPLLAQFSDSSFASPAAKPMCVYKGVMSDAEIEICTGYPVRYNYNYAIDSRPIATRAAAGIVVIQAPKTRLAPRASRN